MKTLILILCLSTFSCRTEKEVQSYLIQVTLIKVDPAFRVTGMYKWQTWEGSDGVIRTVMVHKDDPHIVGDKAWVLVKR